MTSGDAAEIVGPVARAPRDPLAFHGRVETRRFESELLRGNRAGDPATREVPVYLPPGWDEPGARFPALFVLVGFTGKPEGMLGAHPWHPGAVLQYDRLVARGEAAPAILVLPDCWTCLGGSQYVDSAFNGPYESHVVRELVPWIDAEYPVLPGRRGVVGKSSGGFGALRLAMRHPDVFPAASSISGDCSFEHCFGAEMLGAARGLMAYDGDPRAFLDAFRADPKLDGDGHALVNVFAMSAAYSPNPDSPLGFDLPFDPRTGARIDAVWERWLEFDPVRAARAHADGLRALELLHLECGRRDEFYLQLGLRVLRDVLDELEVPHLHEEHEGGHMGISHRYPPAFDRLARHLAR